MRKGGTLRQTQRGELEGWKFEKLGDVCDIVNGSTPLRSKKSFWENGNISWFTIDDIRTQGRIITETKQKVTQTALEESSLRMLPINSVLLCCTASIGEYAITEISLATNQQFNGLVVKNQKLLSPYFLFHYCATLKDKLLNLSGKTTIDFIPISRLREIEIPIPPLSEQQRIVSMLDEAFASIAQAKSNAEQNLVNARELFESVLQSSFENAGEDWEEKKLEELFSIKHGFAFKGEFFTDKGKYVLLTPGNFYEEGGYRDRGEKQKYYVGDFPKDYLLKKGDILVAMTEQAAGLLGSPIIIPESNIFLHNQRLGLIIYKEENKIDTKFLFHLFNTKRMRSLIHQSASGVKVRHTSPSKILEISAFIPPLAEQRAIVGRLEALSAETGRLEEIYQQKVESLEELKRSVLQRAFEGEL